MNEPPKEPHTISQLVTDIKNHPRYLHLDALTKAEIDGATWHHEWETKYMRYQHNIYLREMWRYLYLDADFPSYYNYLFFS
jgi:hypothetical protein